MERSTWRRTLPLTLIIVMVLMLLVAACGATPTSTPTRVPPTATKPPAPPTATTAPVPAATTAPAATAPTATTAPTASAPTATRPPATATQPSAAATVSFAKDVLPIFEKNCTRCHGGGNPRAGLNLTNYSTVMKGGNNPPSVVAGDPDKSPVYTLVKSGVMPFGGSKLPDADAQKIYDWIKAGAPNN